MARMRTFQSQPRTQSSAGSTHGGTVKVTLELTKEQAETVVRALDLYSRIGCGQFHEIEAVLLSRWREAESNDEVRKSLDAAKNHMFPGIGGNTYFSIVNRKVPLDFRRAFDLMKCIQRPLAIARDPNPRYPTVDYDGALLNVSDEPLPRVSVVE